MPIGNKAPFWVLSFSITKTHFCSGCRIQSEEIFKDLNLSNKKIYTKAIAKLNDQKLFAVKIRNIADISNKRRKIHKNSISASLLIKLINCFVYNR